jgi:anaerobic selenocysteine-containing dehydrogenase
MTLTRRRFVELLAGAGVSTLASSWLIDRVLALDAEGELPATPGPGIESWLPTACGLCQGGCGLEVRRIDGLPVGIRGFAGHPVNRGKLCSLPHGAIQMLFSPGRVRRPLKRSGRRGQGLWTEISWDEAEGAIQERLRTLIGAGSRARVAFLDGRGPGLGQTIARAFMAGIGSPHYATSIEARSEELGGHMFGWGRFPGADLEHSRVVVLFGFDHLETDGSPVWQSRIFGQARDRTVDRPIYIGVGPRLFGSMAKCDSWLPARPGTQGIIALAMAHVILENQWENREFLSRHTDWPGSASPRRNGLLGLVRAISPEVAFEIAGVPPASIEDAARRFVEHQPGVALVGPGTLAIPTGTLALAAVNLLNVLLGAVGKPGTLVELQKLPLAEVWDSTGSPSAISDEAEESAITNPTQLLHALLQQEPTPIDLLFIREANPVFESPLATKFRRGLASYDRMVVVFATELDETATLADLVLPEPTFLERWDILTDTPIFPRAHVSLQQPAITPLFSSRQSEETLVRVGNALGELSHVTFRVTRPDELARLSVAGMLSDQRGAVEGVEDSEPAASDSGSAGPWKAFQANIVWAPDEADARFAAHELRIETSPGPLLGLSEEPSDTELRDWASPRNVGLANRYPYQLVVFRTAQLRDGATTNVPMMMELAGHWPETMWLSWAEMNPRTAAEARIVDGDTVRVVSELGHIELVARVSEATPPGLVAVPVGLGHTAKAMAAGIGVNVNLIVAAALDPVREQTTRVNVLRV